MKILYLYSDWRWTGPAEPVLQCAKAVQDRGHEVVVAVRAAPAAANPDESVEKKARAYGLNCTTELGLSRYLRPGETLRDLWQIPRLLRREQFDIMHTSLCHDHSMGSMCARLLGAKRPRVVRSLFRRTVLKNTLGYRLQLRTLADGLLACTPSFRQTYIEQFHLPEDKIRVMPMTIDIDRFRPGLELTDMRPAFGIPADVPVIGLVTRFQKYRRMELFFNAAAAVIKAAPETRFVLLGASSHMQETVVLPMKRLGLEDRVIIGGYRMDDYVDTLASFDIFSLLMPGFDGTARAVREAMAMGIPTVVSDFGMLPEIVTDGVNGLVAPLEVKPLADAWLALIRDPDRRAAMGHAAREYAEKNFSLAGLGKALTSAYRFFLYGEETRRTEDA